VQFLALERRLKMTNSIWKWGVAITCLVIAACESSSIVQGNGRLETQERSIQDFSGIDVAGNNAFLLLFCHHRLLVTVQQADPPIAAITGDENLLPFVRIENRDARLNIALTKELRTKRDISIVVNKPISRSLEAFKGASDGAISNSLGPCAEIRWDLGNSRARLQKLERK